MYTELVHKTLFKVRQQILRLQFTNMYLQTISERQPVVLSATNSLPWILSIQQNDNQAAHKANLRNVENLAYWSGQGTNGGTKSCLLFYIREW